MSSILSTQTNSSIIFDDIILEIIYGEKLLQYLYPLPCSENKTNKLCEIKERILDQSECLPSSQTLFKFLNTETKRLEKFRSNYQSRITQIKERKLANETDSIKLRKYENSLKIMDGILWLREEYFANIRVSLCKEITNFKTRDIQTNYTDLLSVYLLIGETISYIEKKIN